MGPIDIHIPLMVVLGIAYLYGYIAIFMGTWKPSRFSWAIWFFVDLVILATTKASGGPNSASMLLIKYYMTGSAIVAILSIWYGENVYSPWNVACVIGAGVSLAVWKLLGTPQFPLILAMSAHLCGNIPTMIKAWQRPQNEDRLVWFLWIAGAGIAIYGICGFTFTGWTWSAAAFPVYDFVCCALIFLFACRKSTANVSS